MGKIIKIVVCVLIFGVIQNVCIGQRRPIITARERLSVERTQIRQQPNPGRKLLAVKEIFIAKRLNLTTQQGKAFWPLYRQYEVDLMDVRKKIRLNNSATTTDGTVQIDNEIALGQQLIEIRKHYRDEFLKVLPPEKVSEIYKSEREFNDELLKQLSERNTKPTS